jgi:hypothetical protein
MSFDNNDDVVQLAGVSSGDPQLRRLGAFIKTFDTSSRTAAVRIIFAAVANRSRCGVLSA